MRIAQYVSVHTVYKRSKTNKTLASSKISVDQLPNRKATSRHMHVTMLEMFMNTTCKRSAISLPSQLPKLSFRVSRERVGAGAPPPQSSHGWACREVARRLPDSRMIDWYQYDVNAFTTQQIKWWQRSWWQSVPPVHRFAFYLQWNKAECKRIPSELHHALFIYQTLPSPRNPSVWNKPPPPPLIN